MKTELSISPDRLIFNSMFISKLPQTGTTIFTVMSSLAQQHNAINLGQGFPDFPMDEELIEAVSRAMRNGHNQYVHMAGFLPLREKIAEKISNLYQTEVHPADEITVTPGGTYAIYSAITTAIHPGDEVIVFEPVYDSYIPNILVNGGVPVIIPLEFPGYGIPWQQVQEAITPNTRMIIINSPHNPTGAVLTAEDMAILTELTRNTQILIVSDEVYEHLVFDGRQHESVLKYPELRARSFAAFSFGKTFHCTGWKMGYCVAPPDLTTEFRKVHQFNAFSVNSPMQVGIAEYLSNNESYLHLGEEMQGRRDFLRQALRETGLQCLPSGGSYFECYSYAALSDLPEMEMAEKLVMEAGVATIPVSAFYAGEQNHQVLRFCFAKKEETLQEAAGRLKQWAQQHNSGQET